MGLSKKRPLLIDGLGCKKVRAGQRNMDIYIIPIKPIELPISELSISKSIILFC